MTPGCRPNSTCIHCGTVTSPTSWSFDYPEKFISLQVGHAYASTTAIYTGVSDDYRNRLVQRSLKDRYPDLWEDE
jgi:hypothetical protein